MGELISKYRIQSQRISKLFRSNNLLPLEMAKITFLQHQLDMNFAALLERVGCLSAERTVVDFKEVAQEEAKERSFERIKNYFRDIEENMAAWYKFKGTDEERLKRLREIKEDYIEKGELIKTCLMKQIQESKSTALANK